MTHTIPSSQPDTPVVLNTGLADFVTSQWIGEVSFTGACCHRRIHPGLMNATIRLLQSLVLEAFVVVRALVAWDGFGPAEGDSVPRPAERSLSRVLTLFHTVV